MKNRLLDSRSREGIFEPVGVLLKPSGVAHRIAVVGSTVLLLGIVLSLVLMPRTARAANITVQGTISTDDAVQLFDFTVATAGSVDLRSYGYAGGRTSTGTVTPPGGFDTVLTLFDASGIFLSQNDEGAGVATDPSTGLAADARITQNLTVGSYILALTEYDNFSNGNLADGFSEAGHPNFTADPSFTTGGPCPGNMFRDISGTAGRCRNGNWALDFVNVASVTPVATTPEPSALPLAGCGLILLLAMRFRGRRLATLLIAGAALVLASLPGQAQTNCPTSTSGPDYCHVSDFLNGQRTLLNVTDLQITSFNFAGYNENGILNPGYIATTNLNSSNSQQTFVGTANSPAGIIGVTDGDAVPPLLSFSARMFRQPQAVTLTVLGQTTNSNFALSVANPAGASLTWSPLPGGSSPLATAGAVADFTGDGYSDLALGFDDGTILVLTPNDLTDPTKGPRTTVTKLNYLQAMAAGDFNGDGRPELAGLTVVPPGQPGAGGLALVIYSVDPNTLAVSLAGAASLLLTTPDASPTNPITHVSMARGRFNSAGHDQLAVAFATNTGAPVVQIIDFALDSLTPRAGPQGHPAVPGESISQGFVQVKTGQFGFPNSSFDQIVFNQVVYQRAPTGEFHGGPSFFLMISVNPTTLAVSGYGAVSYSKNGDCGFGIDVGNFDHRQPSQGSSGQTQPDPNAQIALLTGACSANGSNTLRTYSVDAQTLAPAIASTNNLPRINWSLSDLSTFAIVATDSQGRSVSLGEPTKISIGGTIQPTAVVGAPPMHVDYIDPGDGNGARVFNVSVVPDGFKTTYQQDKSTGYASNTTHTTSWSFGAKESVTAGFSIGDPDVEGIKATDTFTAAQDLKGTGENTQGAYAGKSFNLSATTGFGDEVSYTESQFNIWVYDVIGQTICPAGTTCPPNQKVPLTLQYSAPDANSQQPEAVQGQALQWYQPPWEPGNIFSYPANYDQLKSHYRDIVQLTNETTGFLTDGSTLTQTATWSGSTEGSDSTGLEQNYSFENDYSVNGSVGISGLDASGGYGLDLSGSAGFSSLIKNTSTLGKSTGLEISKPGTFPAFQNYGYSVNPYIVGTAPSSSVVDNQVPSADIQTFGLLRAVFTADPLSQSPPAGGWWQQAYTEAPDVALNHPSRWTYATLALPSTNNIPDNCLSVGDGKSMDCAVLNQRSPANPWLDIFHFMRGFFISSAASKGQGPQLEQAKAGDVLSLQARVYNYSLADMDPGTEVHVRFYFTPWNPKRNIPAGESVLIHEEKTGPIPAFNESSGPNAQPNWVLVPTTFDTSQFDQTKNGNASIVFWVVVWMQDGQGNLLGEMPAHGLKMTAQSTSGIPGTLTSLNDAAQLEEVAADGHTYSNNVGIYKQTFFIAAPSLGASPGPAPANASIDLGKLDVSADRATPGEVVVLSTTLSTRGGDASGISVNFYDGDPNDGGQLFAVERIPHVNADDSQMVQTTYQGNTCGVHRLVAVINRGQASEVIRRAEPVRVECK